MLPQFWAITSARRIDGPRTVCPARGNAYSATSARVMRSQAFLILRKAFVSSRGNFLAMTSEACTSCTARDFSISTSEALLWGTSARSVTSLFSISIHPFVTENPCIRVGLFRPCPPSAWESCGCEPPFQSCACQARTPPFPFASCSRRQGKPRPRTGQSSRRR